MPNKVIVKIQRPLMTNGDDLVYLVYAEGRKNMVEVLANKLSKRAIEALEVQSKAFFYAEWKNDTWVIHLPAPWQNW